jgi:hypothetical protein
MRVSLASEMPDEPVVMTGTAAGRWKAGVPWSPALQAGKQL